MRNNTNTNTIEKTIDLTYIEQLADGNKKFVKDMINLFISENSEEIKSLELAIKEKNYNSIKTLAHKLRSTIPFVGLDKIIDKDIIVLGSLASKMADIKEIEKHFFKIKAICEKAYIDLAQPVILSCLNRASVV